jgi:hypothetical protein
MPPGRLKSWVVARNEDNGELFSKKPFNTLKEAESYKRIYSEQLDPRGKILEVSIEVLPTHTFPDDLKPIR